MSVRRVSWLGTESSRPAAGAAEVVYPRPVADLIERVTAAELAPIYILGSEHPLLIERSLTAIRDAAVPPEARGFNYDVVDAKGASAQQVLAAAQTLPMMAARRLVLVRDLADMPAEQLNRLIDYLAEPNPTTVLVGVTRKIDKRIKFYAAAKKRSYLHELAPPRSLLPWLRDEARARAASVSKGVCERLIEVVGKDMARLALALDQLALYAGERAITVEDVDDLIADTRERTVFELTDAIGAGDLPAALGSVASLCEQRQSAIGVVVMMARFMRQLGKCKLASAQRLAPGPAAKLVGAPPFAVKKMMGQARRYSSADLAKASRLLATADQQLKGHDDTIKVLGRELGERVVLDRLVRAMIELGQARP